MIIYQMCSGKWILFTKYFEIVDVEESFEGYDIYYYKCPDCGEIHRSKAYKD